MPTAFSMKALLMPFSESTATQKEDAAYGPLTSAASLS